MLMLRRHDRLAVPAAITITIACVAVLAGSSCRPTPIWVTADTAVIFAFAVGLNWYRIL